MVAGAALVTATWWRAAPPSVGAGATLTDAGRLTGLLAGYVALLQVMLRIRLPLVERGLGTDSINQAHRLLGGYLIVLIVRFLTPGAWFLAHPYSLSEEPGGRGFRITVRAAGRHAATLAKLPAGTRVIAEGPCGGLIAAANWTGPVALIAGGIGITPLRALFAAVPCAEHAITLIYRVHDAEDIVFRAELEQIAAQRGGQVHFLAGRRDDPRNDLSPASLTRLCPDLARSRVFICGPVGYAQTIRASLAAVGVPPGRVRSESFQM
jgi:ferredoxin-NADP reductase